MSVFKKDWHGFLLKLRWQAASSIVPRRTVYSRGLQFTLPCDNWKTYYRWQTYNSKEPETFDWIDTWVREGDTFFDIGANIGIYTIYVALRHPGARVVAFEPEYANLHLLRDNVVENSLQGRVEVYSIALSNRSGLSHLHIQDFTPGAALHTESRDTLSITRMRRPVIWREGICVFTMDAFCDETGLQPQCIKIDVDGTEPEVLEGAVRTLSSPGLRSLIIELPRETRARDTCEELLLSAGLQREWRDPFARSSNEVWIRKESRGSDLTDGGHPVARAPCGSSKL